MRMLLRMMWLVLLALLPSASGFAIVQEAAAAPSGTFRAHLPLIMGHPGAPERQPSSLQLIEAAREAGTINDETALLYKVQAIVGDSALPQQYRGDDEERDGSGVMDEIVESFDTLSPELQSRLQPYLLPPAASGSWFEQNEVPAQGARNVTALTWETVGTGNGKVKIWYHPEYGDAARARTLAQELNNRIWPEITTVMRQEPLPDCGAACPQGGGDSRMDIYLVNTNMSYAKAFTCCAGSPGFLVLGRTATFGRLTEGFMRVNQLAYSFWSYREYEWIRAATAIWAIDYVYPKFNHDPDYPRNHEEHAFALDFLEAAHLPLETVNYGHEYGAYLFPYFIDDPSTVADIFHDAAFPDSLLVVNSQLFQGFRNVWPQFVLENWNHAPIDSYMRDDELTASATTPDDYVLLGAQTLNFLTDVPHLAAYYYQFEFPDRESRRVIFNLPFAGGNHPTARVWAIPQINGSWGAPEDWTSVSEKIFCRDRPQENLEKLVLIISNSEYENRNHVLNAGEGKAETTRAGCEDTWIGGTMVRREVAGPSLIETMTAEVVWERDPNQFENPEVYEAYIVRSGGLTWSLSGSIGQCTHSAGPINLPIEPDDGRLVINTSTDPFTYDGVGATFGQATVTVVCPDDTTTYETPVGIGGWFNAPVTETFHASPDGTVISDTLVLPGVISWQWHFTRDTGPKD